VTPPTVNKKINPKVKINAVFNLKLPPHIVANQLNTLIPVGIAITIVADVKYERVSISSPTVNM
jgi:hypothetical protein